MIYTLTLNPAIDFELIVADFEFDAVSRALGSRVDCGGKGFNVSRMLANLKMPSIAMGLVGGPTGDRLSAMLGELGIDTRFTRIAGETRTNVSLVQAGGSKHLKVNDTGPSISDEELAELIGMVRAAARPGDWWVLAGSLPPGVPDDVYAQLITILDQQGAFTVLDSSGEALRLGCAAGPTLVKPNLAEAEQLTGLVVSDAASLTALAQAALLLGPASLVLSMGKTGALLATPDEQVECISPRIVEQNPIGAGDSMVAGLVWGLSQGQSQSGSLTLGIACGAATASCAGTTLGTLADVEALLANSN